MRICLMLIFITIIGFSRSEESSEQQNAGDSVMKTSPGDSASDDKMDCCKDDNTGTCCIEAQKYCPSIEDYHDPTPPPPRESVMKTSPGDSASGDKMDCCKDDNTGTCCIEAQKYRQSIEDYHDPTRPPRVDQAKRDKEMMLLLGSLIGLLISCLLLLCECIRCYILRRRWYEDYVEAPRHYYWAPVDPHNPPTPPMMRIELNILVPPPVVNVEPNIQAPPPVIINDEQNFQAPPPVVNVEPIIQAPPPVENIEPILQAPLVINDESEL